ncbi:MAG TPA: ATP-binding protein [Puia sp.]|nr:ATP-binding protein [Puia sp.]
MPFKATELPGFSKQGDGYSNRNGQRNCEFQRSAIGILRQPLEDGRIRISRAKMNLEYPASFMLVAAKNPCFCGYFGSKTRCFTCTGAMQ